MGGEKHKQSQLQQRKQGSPPHGRGKAANAPPLCPVSGITPAWAGKSGGFFASAALRWDHPRMGGEKPF